MASDGKYVIVHRTTDPMDLDYLEGALNERGIMARGIGTRDGAAIGVGQHILKLKLEVPANQADEAREARSSKRRLPTRGIWTRRSTVR